MISFISPAMGFNEDVVSGTTTPIYQSSANELVDILKELTPSDISNLMGCSSSIAETTCIRYNTFNKDFNALYTFNGIAYKALDAQSLDKKTINYLNNHLIICSALYGALIPSDKISPYRLEMKTKLGTNKSNSLYKYWQDDIYQAISKRSDGIIVNLASKEYSKCVEKYLKDEIYVTCTFKVNKQGRLKIQSTAAKKARGAMVRWISQNKINDIENLKEFCGDNYTFSPELSNTSSQLKELVFIK